VNGESPSSAEGGWKGTDEDNWTKEVKVGGTGSHGREGGDVNRGRLKEPMMGKTWAVGVYSGIAGADELGGVSRFKHEGRAMRRHGCTDNPMRE